ncbi:MAG: acyl transferase domain-containing protein, partial [Planctomycetota bacterium]
MADLESNRDSAIAIIGMSAHLPGARTWREYWQNLSSGTESIALLDDDELTKAGVPRSSLRNPNYVKRASQLADIELFDPDFFGLSPKEAGIMDPQHRHFLEVCWEALEDAAHTPSGFDGAIGVFAGCGMGSYLMYNIMTNPSLLDSVGMFLLRHTGNDKDFLATRVSYCFDLKGPAVNVQTACSTSLVAVHQACQSLLNMESDMALAGGVTIELPQGQGYMYQEGEVLSPDGHCRAFDKDSKGTVFGSGAGAVVLRRLEDALEDGDSIYAVIRGSAINNDGAGKVGYLAPSVDGQAAAIAEALAVADVEADELSYIECHGTGTPVGDPIEVSAMTQAFRESTDKNAFCAIGSVKTNIGHLDTAAGVAALMKVALALDNEQLPATLNYRAANPNIDFASTPFFVNAETTDWKRGDKARIAGVNSLGVGGTNAHVVLEEAPVRAPSGEVKSRRQLICLSAKSKSSLDGACDKLAEFLKHSPETKLADVAFTLKTGRTDFDRRRVLVASSHEEAIELLESKDLYRVFTHTAKRQDSGVAFLLPGGGAQHPLMARGLYETETVYREQMDRGLALLETLELGGAKVDFDLRALLFAPEAELDKVTPEFERPAVQLPAIFLVEYALAKLWMSWGIEPKALLGHSMGENTAACLAGVITFEDALGLVTLRGRLFETVPSGGMLSVSLRPEELEAMLSGELCLATINAPELCAVSGPTAEIEAFGKQLAERDIDYKRIPIDIAAHSAMLDPMLGAFGDYLRSIKLSPPQIRFVSNLTGTWITEAEATDPGYWVRHLRNTVKFADGIGTLMAEGELALLEVGPGKTLSSLAKMHSSVTPEHCVLSSLRHPDQQIDDTDYFLGVYGRLWAAGFEIDDGRLWTGKNRQRISLPTYAFQRQRYWIEPGQARAKEVEIEELERVADASDFFWRPSWSEQRAELQTAGTETKRWLVFIDESGLGKKLCERLIHAGNEVIQVHAGDLFFKHSDTEYTLAIEHGRVGYQQLFDELAAIDLMPERILHGWSITADESFRPGSSFFHRTQECGFYSLLHLAQVLGDFDFDESMHIVVMSNGMQSVTSEALTYPEKATLLGPCGVIPRELPGVTVASVDINLPAMRGWRFGLRRNTGASLDSLADELWNELLTEPKTQLVAWRDSMRYVHAYTQRGPSDARAIEVEPAFERIRPGGTYLITGGLGDLGLVLAEHLAREAKANLVLLARTPLPEEDEWEAWLHRNGPSEASSKKILKVRELQTLGSEVMLANTDVTDVDGMRAVLEGAKKRFGKIDGVFHAAGMLRDGLIPTKSELDIEEVLSPKIQGTLVLDNLFRDEQLDVFVLFSSTSAAITPAGQVDYVAANAFLNAYAQARHGSSTTYTVAVGWGVWSDVGMAARTLPSAAGPAHGDLHDAQHPLFESVMRCRDGRIFVNGCWNPESQWFLDEHRTKQGQALIPGTGYFELARVALSAAGETGPFEVRDLFFFQPLQISDEENKDVRLRLTPESSGYLFEVQSKHRLDDGREAWATHGQAHLGLRGFPAARSLDLAAVTDRCNAMVTPENENGIQTGQEQHLRFGPRWRVLRSTRFGEREALARLQIPAAYQTDLEQYHLHPALLDLATGFPMELIEGYTGNELWVPVSYRCVRIHSALTSEVYAWARSCGTNDNDNDFASFDVILTDEGGRVLMEVEEFSIHKLESTFDFGAAPTINEASLEFEGGSEQERSLSPAEQRFRDTISLGLKPHEGMAALDTILRSATSPELLVTSLNLEMLQRMAAEALATPAHDDAKFARPELDSEFVEARDDVERTLVGFWEQLLGVD